MSEHLIDIDELVLRCKDNETRKYIAEAVACYKIGSFRAGIVATWIAIVYDFIYKLRQLELTGDRNASTKLEDFERARSSNSPELALRFEKQILTWAKDEFEFISPMQYADLGRLFEDRNRCAHPSMITADEIYQPSAELARYHLRNAITHLIAHPPVQGKAALNRLHNDTLSEYFPPEIEKAIEYFRHGPLANPKPVLVRDFVISLLKNLLLNEHSSENWLRFMAAFGAVWQMHRPIVEQSLGDQFSTIAQRILDQDLRRPVRLINSFPVLWNFLEGDAQARIENYILNLKDEEVETILPLALDLPQLHSKALIRLNSLEDVELQTLISMNPRPEYISRVITLYKQVTSFAEANYMAKLLVVPVIQFMKEEDVERLVICATTNSQIMFSTQFPKAVNIVKEYSIIDNGRLRKMMTDNLFPDDVYQRIFPEDYQDSE